MAVGIQQRVPANAQSVGQLRHAVTDFVNDVCPNAERIVDDVALAVSEACTNVVRHAYPDRPGELRLVASIHHHVLTIVISDDGIGLCHPTASPGAGFGFRLMCTVAETTVRSGRGTNVELSFPCPPRRGSAGTRV